MKTTNRNYEVVSVKEAMRRLDCGRSTVYRLMKDEVLESVKIRAARRIKADSIDRVATGSAA